MFLDASIVVAITMREQGWEAEYDKLQVAGPTYFYTATVRYEAVIAIARISALTKGARVDSEMLKAAEIVFDGFVDAVGATEIAITQEIGREALVAAGRYGKIVGHRAALNFGDCFSYAAAKSLKSGLLYKGRDFSETDLA